MGCKNWWLLMLMCVGGVYGQRLSGTVSDDQGLPLNGTEVFLEAENAVAITDFEGKYSFEAIESGTYKLTVFALGFSLLETQVTVNGDTRFDVVMEQKVQELSEVVLTQEREKVFALKNLRKVEGTAIFAGKKSEVVLMDGLTANLATSNPRQIYAQIAGLNIYENGDAGLQLNIGGRGLDPNRTAHFNVRQNGYDISADALGYPESYYTPPAEAIDQIRVVRGAASLQYGPQFGGLIDFRLKKPVPNKEFELVSRQTLGSNNLFTSFNSVSGTKGNWGYYGYFNYKEGEGFRPNSEFNSRGGYALIEHRLSDKTKLSAEVTLFNYLAHQPGGLTDAQFYEDSEFSNRTRNWFDVDWKLFSLSWEQRFSSQSEMNLRLFALDASRQALGFRTNRVSQPDDLEEPRELLADGFNNWGAELRWLNRYDLWGKEAVLLLGGKYYQSYNKQKQGPGSVASDPDFTFYEDDFPNYERQSQFDFPNLNLAFFGEQVMNISDSFSITPGFRFEYIKTKAAGNYRNIVLDLAGNPLVNELIEDNRAFERSFLLAGLGLSFKPSGKLEVYGNISQNYRSVTFNDIRVVNPSFQVDENISDEDGFTADLGVRGRLGDTFRYDLSAFGLYYNNRLGEVLQIETRPNPDGGVPTPTGRLVRFRTNVGTAFMYGLETFADWNLREQFFAGATDWKLNVFSNLALTASEYLESDLNNVEGNAVEFVPLVNLKTGLNFGYKNLLGSLQYTYLSSQYTDATNAEQDKQDNQRGIEGEIPAYDILDLSLSYTYKKWRLETGVNNLLDNSYFTRRATGYPGPGIIPAENRTFYTTLQFKF
jgi:Fe(3+) dicitrate transport protein